MSLFRSEPHIDTDAGGNYTAHYAREGQVPKEGSEPSTNQQAFVQETLNETEPYSVTHTQESQTKSKEASVRSGQVVWEIDKSPRKKGKSYGTRALSNIIRNKHIRVDAQGLV